MEQLQVERNQNAFARRPLKARHFPNAPNRQNAAPYWHQQIYPSKSLPATGHPGIVGSAGIDGDGGIVMLLRFRWRASSQEILQRIRPAFSQRASQLFGAASCDSANDIPCGDPVTETAAEAAKGSAASAAPGAEANMVAAPVVICSLNHVHQSLEEVQEGLLCLFGCRSAC